MQPRLIVLSGPMKGSEFSITTDRLTIGRAPDNRICIDDHLLSRHHCAIWLKDGRSYLEDGDTRNGTWINGKAYFKKFLEHHDCIEGGVSTFFHALHDVPPNDLPVIMEKEAYRRQELETLRADYHVRDEAAVYYNAVNKVYAGAVESLNAFEDMELLHKRLLDSAFEIIPATRGAIWLNGQRVSSDPDYFDSKIYKERGFDGPTRFVLSQTVLDEVYKIRQPILTTNITPVVCAPLMLGNGICGVMYLEGLQAQARRDSKSRFEPEHLQYLKGIAGFAAAARRIATKYEIVSDHRDVLKEEHGSCPPIIGNSPKILEVLELADKAAKHDVTVLILGETGTGKELIARRIHELSSRRDNACVAVNCGAIPENLLESELFGHAKGAFTGAMEARKGKFKQADTGTIFLDEAGDLTPKVQVALLRVLQERKVEPVGKDEAVPVDVRVIAATKVDLENAVREGKFREDLFYRLHVFVIHMPSLRERVEDIPLLVDHFLEKYGSIRRVQGISDEAMEALKAYAWPGNVRELENVIYAALVHGASEIVQLGDFSNRIKKPEKSVEGQPQSGKSLGRQAAIEARRRALLGRMNENGGDVLEAAQWLGMSKSQAYRLLSDE